jgi:lambda family phage portal protein
MYAGARNDRLTAGWTTSNTSADAELVASLTSLRSRSRALVRDSSYAKRARALVVNNVIGQGIGLQAQVYTTRDDLNERVNLAIEETFAEWGEADTCHTGGRLDFAAFEQQCIGQVFEAGEVLIRMHPRAFGAGDIPFALELIEAERIADEYHYANVAVAPGNSVRMGVEMDRYFRPSAYYLRTQHPSEIRWTGQARDEIERVPADQIIHLAVVNRWPQTRGEPWLHTVVRRLNDLDGYTEAEVVRARGQAVRMGIIETSEDLDSLAEEQPDGSYEAELQPGTVQRLNPGEKWHDSAPTAPNPQLDPFMRYMLREMAAGVGCTYESLSRDYSQSNYSSSRLALLDDRDLWRMLQGWFVAVARQRIHRAWLQAAVLSRSIAGITVDDYAADPRKFAAVKFRPRGWGWVDPTKEVEAYKNAVRCGFMTQQDVVSQAGADLEEIIEQRERETAMAADAGLVFDTDPKAVPAPGAAPAPAAEPKDDDKEPSSSASKGADDDDDGAARHGAGRRVLNLEGKLRPVR